MIQPSAEVHTYVVDSHLNLKYRNENSEIISNSLIE